MNCENLIELVRNKPFLYNVKHSDHKNRIANQNAWKMIANELGCQEEEAKKKWRYLRDQYIKKRRYYHEAQRSGTVASDVLKVQSWPLFYHLTWLDDTLDRQKSNHQHKVFAEDENPTSVVVVPTTCTLPDLCESFDVAQHPHFKSSDTFSTQEFQSDWASWAQNDSSLLEPFDASSEGASNEVALEPEVDFFKDMEPTVKVKKVLVRKKTSSTAISNRLAMDQDLDFKVTGELEEWKDEDGWSGNDSDQLDIDEAEILREAQQQRKLERQMRAKQQKQKVSLKSHDKLALKVS